MESVSERARRCGGCGPAENVGAMVKVSEEAAEWLTREEWNACYFLGQEAFYRGNAECGLCEQVAIGIQRLFAAGYDFKALELERSGSLVPRDGLPRRRQHTRSCKEVALGSFDDIGRARAALEWVRKRAPGVSTTWLETLLGAYDRAHATTG